MRTQASPAAQTPRRRVSRAGQTPRPPVAVRQTRWGRSQSQRHWTSRRTPRAERRQTHSHPRQTQPSRLRQMRCCQARCALDHLRPAWRSADSAAPAAEPPQDSTRCAGTQHPHSTVAAARAACRQRPGHSAAPGRPSHGPLPDSYRAHRSSLARPAPERST